MSGFRDTFSKNDEEDGLLNYDDSAFYYFAGTVLLVVLIPWSYFAIKAFFPDKKSRTARVSVKASHTSLMDKLDKEEEDAAKRTTRANLQRNLTKLGLVVALWGCFFYCMSRVGGDMQVKRFDPFELLGLDYSADDKQIKKAYHRLAKEYHPDKNPDDPLAQAHFINIKKAYDTLTDDAAKKNFEKYGNPDGPQATKVGIGLPAWLLSKDNQIGVLVAFFLIIIVIIPAFFISYYNKTKKYAANGILLETMQFLGYYINDGTRFKALPEMLAASAESRALKLRPTDDTDMKKLSEVVQEGQKRKYNLPIVVKNQYLIWGHLQRCHAYMSQNLRDDLNELLKFSQKICQVMVEISCMREWFFTAQAVLEFQRSLVQGIDTKNKGHTILQIPHYNEEQVKHCLRGKKPLNSIRDFVKMEPDALQVQLDQAKFDSQQKADIEDFLKNFPDVTMSARAYVEDEDEICVGDIVTVEFMLTRNHLNEGESQGTVHAPFFPKSIKEEWWIFLLDPSGASRILGHMRKKGSEREIVDKICFQAGKPGQFNYVIHALSDSFLGIDQEVKVSFLVKTESEVSREIYVHPEDVELDKVPTLFEQFVGAVKEDESEDEDDESEKEEKKAASSDSDSSSSGSSSSDSDMD